MSNLAQSSSVLLKYILPISSGDLYVPSKSIPTCFSMYVSIDDACACLMSSELFGIPPSYFSVLESLYFSLSGLFKLNAL